jgi:Carboxypeptidase regulatory-like domain
MRRSATAWGMGILAVMLWTAAGPAQAQTRQTARGTIQGEVVDANGAPVPRAEIVWQTADGRSPHALRSDAHGRFRIAKVHPGLYELRAAVKGTSSDWEHNLLVRAGRDTDVLLQLSSTPPVNAAAVHQKDTKR